MNFWHSMTATFGPKSAIVICQAYEGTDLVFGHSDLFLNVCLAHCSKISEVSQKFARVSDSYLLLKTGVLL